jgi:hypothetical protein
MAKLFKNHLGAVIFVLVVFVGGFGLGLAINNIPYFSFSSEVSVSDIANLLLTIIVAFWIPITLSPIITNKRTIKDFLIDEVKDCIAFLTLIKNAVDEAALQGTTSEATRKKINSMVSRDLSMKLSSLINQLNLSFEKQSAPLRKDIDEKSREYWQETTGGGLMSRNYNIDVAYCVAHDKNFFKIEACLKKAVHEINNY